LLSWGRWALGGCGACRDWRFGALFETAGCVPLGSGGGSPARGRRLRREQGSRSEVSRRWRFRGVAAAATRPPHRLRRSSPGGGAEPCRARQGVLLFSSPGPGGGARGAGGGFVADSFKFRMRGVAESATRPPDRLRRRSGLSAARGPFGPCSRIDAAPPKGEQTCTAPPASRRGSERRRLLHLPNPRSHRANHRPLSCQ